MRDARMVYRSPLTRLLLAAVGVTAGVLLIWGGEKWRAEASLHWLAQAPLPIGFWGACWLLYAFLLIASDTTRALGYALGCVLYAVFTMSLLATVGTPGPKSIVSIGAMVDATVFHAFSIRTTLTQRLQ